MRFQLRYFAVFALLAYACAPSGSRAAPSSKQTSLEIRKTWPADYGWGLDPWRRHRATRTRAPQQLFVYEGKTESRFWSEGGPPDGARRLFVINGSYERGRAVYDPVHRIAYLNRGCCSEFSSVLSTASAPEYPLPARDLTGVYTTLGLRLGDPPWRVRAKFGSSELRSVAGFAGLQELSYYAMRTRECGTWQNVFFREARAVRIEIVSAC